MTRQARTLLVLVLFGAAAILALGGMARRYGAILEHQSGATETRPAGTAAEAERRVSAFVAVRERLADERARSLGRPESEVRERIARVIEHALRTTGLDRAEYTRIEAMVEAWERDGTAPPEPYRSSLSRVREYLRDL